MNDSPKTNDERKSKTRKLNAILWTCIIILIILLLLTTTVVVLCLGNFLPIHTNIIFLVPKEPSFSLSDGGGWDTDGELEIFKSQYEDGNGEIVICSANGDSVIAPGVDIDYPFELNNNGNMAIDYDIALNFKFTIGGEEESLETIPMLVRVSRNDGTYLLGGEDTWVPVSQAGTIADSGTLGVKCYTGYDLDIRWEYESGNDAHDTWLGDKSVEEDLVFSVAISTYAEENADYSAQGGTLRDDGSGDVPVANSIRWIPFLLLLFPIILLIIAIICLLLSRKKSKEEEAAEVADGAVEGVVDGAADALTDDSAEGSDSGSTEDGSSTDE